MNPWLLDGLVILAYFVVVISIGLFKGRGERSMEGFAVGDRNIPWWAVLASLLAAEVSAGTFLGTPGEGYGLRNFTYVQLAIGTILARIIVAYVFIKRFYDLRVVSIYEFLETRFGRTTKLSSSLLFLITRALASGSRMFVPAILLVGAWEMIKDVHPNGSETLLLYVGAVAFLVLITAIYTTFGGIKAVVWTDLIQVTLMFGAMFYATFTLWHAVGGWKGVEASAYTAPVDAEVVEARTRVLMVQAHGTQTEDQVRAVAREQVAASSAEAAKHALTFWDTGLHAGRGFWENVKGVLETEYTIFSAFLASVFVTMATHGTDQDMVQRMLTARDHRQSRRALVLSGVLDVPVMAGFLLVGILLWVFYRANPDPHLPAKESEIFAYFILRELPSGVRGLLVAGVFATAMGSLSTALNALATSFTEDWYRPYLRRGSTPDEATLIRATRRATAGFAALLVVVGAATAWAAIVLHSRIIPIVLGVFGYTYGSLLGVFLVGALTKTRGSDRGNLVAMATGFVAVVGLGELPHRLDPALPKLAFPWFILLGTVATVAVALAFRTPVKQRELAERHRAERRPKA